MQRRFLSRFRTNAQMDGEMPVKQRNGSPFLVRALKKICFGLGALVLFSLVMGIFSAMLLGGPVKFPKEMILVLNVTQPIGETQAGRSLMDPLAPVGITVQDLVATLDHAKDDERVKGLLVSLDYGGIELAHVEEIRAAIKRFRATGKFAHIYTPSFADLGSGIGAYYLATAFDEIWMQPVGMVSMTGISMEMPFAKKALDKAGVKAEFLHREEYKTAMESFTNEQMSAPNQEMTVSMLNDMTKRISRDIKADRKLNEETFERNLNKGLITGADALKDGLISHLDYGDVLVEKMQKKDTDNEIDLVAVEDYFDAAVNETHKGMPDVALVRIAGEIVPGDEPEPGYATADYIAGAMQDAIEDDGIKVIVLRIDSPGGSPTASETIRRAVVKAKENGKKVIVSMGPLAASGGYWVAVDADRIFALPSTLTGSIGVIMGKFDISGLWDKLGVGWDVVSWGDNARIWTINKPMSKSERAAMEQSLDDTYASFIERVAKGRNMKPEKVRALAKGRVWTGEQARQNGIIDDLGGLDTVLDYAATLVGKKDRTQLRMIELPEPLSPFEQIMHMMGQQVTAGTYKIESAPVLKSLAPYLRRADVLERTGPVQVYNPDLLLIKP